MWFFFLTRSWSFRIYCPEPLRILRYGYEELWQREREIPSSPILFVAIKRSTWENYIFILFITDIFRIIRSTLFTPYCNFKVRGAADQRHITLVGRPYSPYGELVDDGKSIRIVSVQVIFGAKAGGSIIFIILGSEEMIDWLSLCYKKLLWSEKRKFFRVEPPFPLCWMSRWVFGGSRVLRQPDTVLHVLRKSPSRYGLPKKKTQEKLHLNGLPPKTMS